MSGHMGTLVLTTGPQIAHQHGTLGGSVWMESPYLGALTVESILHLLTYLFNHLIIPQTVTEHPLHARLLQAERNKACLPRSLIPLRVELT